jgi:hypothetical protein
MTPTATHRAGGSAGRAATDRSKTRSSSTSFPALGLAYGVFAPYDFDRGIWLGHIRADDEDDGNANSYYAPSDALLAAQRIVQEDTSVSHGATILRLARVL